MTTPICPYCYVVLTPSRVETTYMVFRCTVCGYTVVIPLVIPPVVLQVLEVKK